MYNFLVASYHVWMPQRFKSDGSGFARNYSFRASTWTSHILRSHCTQEGCAYAVRTPTEAETNEFRAPGQGRGRSSHAELDS